MFGFGVPEISVTSLKERLDNGSSPLLLDVRGEDERQFASIGGTHIEMGSLVDRLEELADHRELDIVVYCRSGVRSANVVRFLKREGYERALNLKGGILAWSREIDPSVPQY